MTPGQVKTASALVLISISFSLAYLLYDNANRAPDFTAISVVEERKQTFFDYFRPLILEQNQELRSDRAELQEFASRADDLSWLESYALADMAARYELDTTDLSNQEIVNELLLRVDTIPASLVLAQAAKESGWGTARFALEGNNYFGQRCWERGCGIVPTDRDSGKRYEVASYDSSMDSLQSYMQNLNTHDEYEEFRTYRAQLRATGQPLSGLKLAEHLGMYSERRQSYIKELQSLIRFNKLEETH
jgi:Bax protein